MAREIRIVDSLPSTLPMTPAIAWLLQSGASAATPSALMEGLCGHLVDEGMLISGAVLVIASLDPLVARRRLRWTRVDGRVVEDLQLHGVAAARGGRTPIRGVRTRFQLSGMDRRRKWKRSRGRLRSTDYRSRSDAVHEVEFFSEQREGFAVAELLHLSEVSLAMRAPLQVVI